jgi:hypothetical protein
MTNNLFEGEHSLGGRSPIATDKSHSFVEEGEVYPLDLLAKEASHPADPHQEPDGTNKDKHNLSIEYFSSAALKAANEVADPRDLKKAGGVEGALVNFRRLKTDVESKEYIPSLNEVENSSITKSIL